MKGKKYLAMALASAMTVAVVGCGSSTGDSGGTASTDAAVQSNESAETTEAASEESTETSAASSTESSSSLTGETLIMGWIGSPRIARRINSAWLIP